jgi:hypothetical protein
VPENFLKTLGANQRPDQIHQQPRGDDAYNRKFHGVSQPPAGVGIKNADRKKCDRRAYEDKIHHGSTSVIHLLDERSTVR